ncbi:MAG: YqeG family HAD IIIA-type phosphatase [Ruminococcaceae bacterium]|nr:YqeG family HAD IIIA-type phosphatase [Oscillospiraceae bacterium]
MIFEKYLVPDRICNCYRDVTPKLLASLGVRYLLCDIDNTLVTYDDPMPTEQLSQWLFILYKSGITVGFVSNNDKERVDGFNKELEYVAYAKAGKPFTKKLKQAMADMGAEPHNTAFLGDQLLTDAAAAKSAGLYSIIVPPIKDKRTLFVRFKRLLEIPYIRKYRKTHPVF